MGMMTDQKRFGMGYNLGGAIKKFRDKWKYIMTDSTTSLYLMKFV
jgi:hypothetical protein